MLQEALRKLQKEIADEKGIGYIEAVGAMLIDHVRQNPHHAPLIVAEDKSIAKAIDAMANEARKRAKNNRAYLTDAEGLGIVLAYYGVAAAQSVTPVSIPTSRLNVSLDDLLD